MLRERSLFLQRGLFLADLALIAVAWVVAYVIRFQVLTPVDSVPLSYYVQFLPFVAAIWGGALLLSGLYQTRRAQRLTLVVWAVARAVGLSLLVSLGASFFYREFSFSRLHMVFFAILSSGFLVGLRLAIYAGLRRARQKGANVRRVLIAGAGKAGQRLSRAFRHYPWMGFEVVGFLDDRGTTVEAEPPDPFYPEQTFTPEVIGTLEEAGEVMDRLASENRPVDMVYAALPLAASRKIEGLAAECSIRTASLALVPDLFHIELLLNSRISDVDGLPVIHLMDEAPFDIRTVVKRGLDIAFSGLVLLALAPLLAGIAIAVKLSSPGPVFYRQRRMGLNGLTFDMLKFRSMPVNAEKASGAVWAQPGENRATRVGAFLRKTSLDELPQFFNVLRGDMSVVGPRPERPVFISEFRHRIPGYMLRHKAKAGITGWAQVNGWRGDTSLEKRIEYDLYYIQNWSLAFDLKIMAMTVVKGFVNENAY
ncbi:undecaprenyl-phosphate glucose phosphotransferase [Rubricoccus marinus]|uniref:Undecaprenyl-phosphate glucose phosphotransferase n=1 Tax=Rubricoccus marinus TaxID=716817 RepID=A0A259U1F9_9BACT|nr:undecaprenyl-phosphate glucose phosphotransferase [Rubricoccus marinus]OZC03654.1 undecaprenyl-phosphate glucose phosphotransferase [Rubricoccus marinus]